MGKSDIERGIEAVNQDFKKYEQVKKDQSYHLVEKENEEQSQQIRKTTNRQQFTIIRPNSIY